MPSGSPLPQARQLPARPDPTRLKTEHTIINVSNLYIESEICGDVLIKSDLNMTKNSLKELSQACVENNTSQEGILSGLSKTILENLQLTNYPSN